MALSKLTEKQFRVGDDLYSGGQCRWSDYVGLYGYFQGITDPSIDFYGIAQLDGTMDALGETKPFGFSQHLNSEQTPLVFDTAGNVYELDTRIGRPRYSTMEAIKLPNDLSQATSGMGYTLLGVRNGKYLLAKGMAKDTPRLGFYTVDAVDGASKEPTLIANFADYPNPSQSHAIGAASLDDDSNRVWLSTNYLSGSDSITLLRLFDLDTMAFVREVHLETKPYDSGGGYTMYVRAWWSRKFKVFIAQRSGGIDLYSPEVAPASVSVPATYDLSSVELTAIVKGNPGELIFSKPFNSWASLYGIEVGDYLYVEPSKLYNGQVLDKSYGPNAISGCSLPVLRVDTPTFKLGFDPEDAVSTLKTTFTGDTGGTYLYPDLEKLNGYLYGEVEADDQLYLSGYPEASLLNDTIVSVFDVLENGHTYVDTGQDFTAVSVVGLAKLYTAGDSYPGKSLVVSADQRKAQITEFELSTPAKFTIDNPNWFDKWAITTTGTVGFHQNDLSFEGGISAAPTITRISATQFTLAETPVPWKHEMHALYSAAQAVMVTEGAFTPGDTIEFSALPGAHAALNGIRAVVQSIALYTGAVQTFKDQSLNEVVLDLDTTGYADLEQQVSNPTGRVHCYKGRFTLHAYVEILSTKATDAQSVPVRTQVLGSNGEPCADFPVAWSTTSGTLKYSATKTDADGWAYNVLYPPVGGGAPQVTATVEW